MFNYMKKRPCYAYEYYTARLSSILEGLAASLHCVQKNWVSMSEGLMYGARIYNEFLS
jgi:hypothetical protein